MTEQISFIPARLKNAAVNGHVAGAEDIIDDVLNRTQNDINEEVAAVPYNATTPNGMGKVVLKKNDNFKQVVEAQTNGNTIFVIKYDFTLTGNVTVPANCVLEFNGGSLNGAYTLTGNNTSIQARLIKIFNTNVILDGSWNVVEAYPEWFGAKGDKTNDDTLPIQKTVDVFRHVFFTNAYYCHTISLNWDSFLEGASTGDGGLYYPDKTGYLLEFAPNNANGRHNYVSHLRLSTFSWNRAGVDGVENAGIHFAGSSEHNKLDTLSIYGFHIGIKTEDTFWSSSISGCEIQNNNYAIKAQCIGMCLFANNYFKNSLICNVDINDCGVVEFSNCNFGANADTHGKQFVIGDTSHTTFNTCNFEHGRIVSEEQTSLFYITSCDNLVLDNCKLSDISATNTYGSIIRFVESDDEQNVVRNIYIRNTSVKINQNWNSIRAIGSSFINTKVYLDNSDTFIGHLGFSGGNSGAYNSKYEAVS